MHKVGRHTCLPLLPHAPAGNGRKGRIRRQPQRRHCMGKSRASADGAPIGIVLECDGVLIDAHREGHRVAFNKAFSDMGMDSMKWNPSVYHDLLRSGDGSPEGMIRAFFDAVGWPSIVSTTDRRSLVADIHQAKKQHLEEMVERREIPLRTGVADFVRDALAAGVKVGTITCTVSTAEERLHEAALSALGPSLAGQLRVFASGDAKSGDAEGGGGSGSGDGGGSADGEGAAGGGLSLEAQFSRQVAQMKQDEASTFIRSLKADSESSVPLGLDPSLLVAARSGKGPVSAAFLAACVATMDLPLRRCAVIAANSSLMQAARSAGMLSIAVPAAMSARGRFSHADATCDGFGSGGGLTLRRVQALLAKANAA